MLICKTFGTKYEIIKKTEDYYLLNEMDWQGHIIKRVKHSTQFVLNLLNLGILKIGKEVKHD